MSIRLSRIYTKTGDDGTTGLASGIRVSKDSPRVCAYGDADEANSAIGLCVVEADRASDLEIATLLRSIQHDMFDLGADLATPITPTENPTLVLRIVITQTIRLENEIDRFNARLKPLTSFVLPGGSPLAAALHLARTVTRRAERTAISLSLAEPGLVNPESIKYLNRLSDLLFVLSRNANKDGTLDILWKPGNSRL